MCTEKIFKIFPRSELLQSFSLLFSILSMFDSNQKDQKKWTEYTKTILDAIQAWRNDKNQMGLLEFGDPFVDGPRFFFFSGGLAWVGCRLDGLDRLGFLFFPRFFPKLQKVEVKERKPLKQKEGGKSTGRS